MLESLYTLAVRDLTKQSSLHFATLTVTDNIKYVA